MGNHDRIIETIDVSESLPEIINEEELESDSILYVHKDIDMELKEYEETEYKLNLRQPENSFLQDTEENMRINKFDLENLASDERSESVKFANVIR
jgi:hypothetical protein